MPEEASKKKYAYLDYLSTAELEAILRAAALSEESDDPAMIDYLLEVIVKREQEAQTVPDVDKMREDFETLYRGLEEPLYPCEEPNRTLEVPRQPTPKKRLLRHIVLAAALVGILIAATCLPVFGYDNVIQMVAYWTAEQFGFRIEDNSQSGNLTRQSNQQLPEEYQELQSVLEKRGIHLSVPNFPEGFVAEEPLFSVDSTTGDIEFTIMYIKDIDYICFNLIYNGGLPSNVYEKDSNMEQYEYAATIHYLFNNTETITAVWVIDNLEYCIFTNSSSVDIKDIIQSVHKE